MSLFWIYNVLTIEDIEFKENIRISEGKMAKLQRMQPEKQRVELKEWRRNWKPWKYWRKRIRRRWQSDESCDEENDNL